MIDTAYVCRPWAYEERKGERYLLIWPDLPMWIVADRELYLFLRLLDGNRDIDEIIVLLQKKIHKRIDVLKKEIKSILPQLINRAVVFRKGEEKRPINQTFEKAKIDNVYIAVTTRCNLNCRMCFNKYNQIPMKEELSTQEIKTFVDQLMSFCEKYANVSISGGEPLIVPEKTFEIAEYLSHKFRYVWIITNGTLVNRKIAKKFRDLGVMAVVSLDGACEKEHDSLRGKGAFKKTIHGIRTFKEEDVYVITNYVIHRNNFRQLDKYFELAKNLHVDEARFVQLKLIGGALENRLEKVYIDEIVDYAYDMFTKHPEYNNLRGRDIFTILGLMCRRSIKQKWCGTGKLTLTLNADGTIFPCASHWSREFAAGNIRKQTFSDIWLNSAVLKNLRKIYSVENVNEKCSQCIVRYWCGGGCRAETYYVTHDMHSPSIECEHIKRAILKMFWILADHPEFGRTKTITYPNIEPHVCWD